MAHMTTTRRFVLLGCGGVGGALLEMLPVCKLLDKDFYSNVIILEPKEISNLPVLKGYRYQHVRTRLTPDNLNRVLDGLLQSGDAVFDCTVNVDALGIMRVCHRIGCLYSNCSMENWDTEDASRIDGTKKGLYDRSLYARIAEAREEFGRTGPTMLADQGMNPGIVSLFALQGIRDMAAVVNNVHAMAAVVVGQYGRAAQALGIDTVHITEQDTQVVKQQRPRGMFYNTWSAVGLVAEALDPIQMGWGTVEGRLPAGGLRVANMAILPHRGMDKTMWSFTPTRHGPGQTFTGFAVPHGEANTLSAKLRTASYQPSVYFVYQPCPVARESLDELRRRRYVSSDMGMHVLTLPEIESGYDAVGALLWSKTYGPWWSGTVLDKEDVVRAGLRFSGPTTVQVAIALIAAMKWQMDHPDQGFITPEDLPLSVLHACLPYLGRVFSGPVPAPFPWTLAAGGFWL